MRPLKLSLPATFLALMVIAWPGVTRGQILAGSLTGTIVDSAGGRVAAAKVVLVETGTASRETLPPMLTAHFDWTTSVRDAIA